MRVTIESGFYRVKGIYKKNAFWGKRKSQNRVTLLVLPKLQTLLPHFSVLDVFKLKFYTLISYRSRRIQKDVLVEKGISAKMLFLHPAPQFAIRFKSFWNLYTSRLLISLSISL